MSGANAQPARPAHILHMINNKYAVGMAIWIDIAYARRSLRKPIALFIYLPLSLFFPRFSMGVLTTPVAPCIYRARSPIWRAISI